MEQILNYYAAGGPNDEDEHLQELEQEELESGTDGTEEDESGDEDEDEEEDEQEDPDVFVNEEQSRG